MKKTLRLLLLLPVLLLTGCFEVLEEVNMNADGSGVFKLTINGSQSKSQLDNVISKDTVGNIKIPKRADIEKKIAEVTTKLKSINGISNVVVTKDFTNYILTVSCNFSNVNSLNTAVNNIWLLYDKNAKMNSVYYSYNQKTFKRSFDYNLIKDIPKKLGSQEKEILAKANYTTIYRFQTEIVSHTNTSASLSKSKKAIIIKNTALDIINGRKSIVNEIKIQ